MSCENKGAKRSKPYCESKKKQKIDTIIEECSVEQSTEKGNSVESLETRPSCVKSDKVKKQSTITQHQDVPLKTNEPEEFEKLRKWIVKNKIPYPLADELLAILRKRLLPTLPKTAAIFLEACNRPMPDLGKVKIEPGISTSEPEESSSGAHLEVPNADKQLSYYEGKAADINRLQNNQQEDTFNYQPIGEFVEVDCFNFESDVSNPILKIVNETNAIVRDTNNRLDSVEKTQKNIINFLTNKTLVEVEGCNFKAFYNVEIPSTTFEEFQNFDEQLLENELLKADVCTQLFNCIDKKDCSITKSFTNMLRLFMTKETLSNFTAIRKSKTGEKERKLFITTNLYKLMAGIVVKQRKDKNLSHDLKDLHSALSDVICHSNKWN